MSVNEATNLSQVRPVFETAAARVRWRLWLRKSCQRLVLSWPYLVGVLAILALIKWTGVLSVHWAAPWILLLGWVVGIATWCYVKRAPAYHALAFWDKAGDHHHDFANAWWLSTQESLTEGGRVHLQRQVTLLDKAGALLTRQIPLPKMQALLLPVLVAAGTVFIPELGVRLLPDVALTEEGRKLAVSEGKKLEERKLDAEKLAGLTEEEKKELEKLQQKVDEAAKALQQDGAKTAREVLSELEKRAREAEKMAEKLAAGEAAWASAKMVAEMRKHADTAELGDAVSAKSAEKAGKEAQNLADKLKNDTLTHETRDRFTQTLSDIGKQAEAQDKERTVGGHVLAADKNMTQTLPKEAGNEFQTLADKMRTLAQREKAREQLEKLAQQLRNSGSSIASQGQQGMQQLAGSPGQQGQQGQQGQPSSPSQSQQGQGMTTMPNAPSMQPMQNPGMSNAPQGQGQGQGQQMQIGTPVPGMAPQPGQNMAVSPGSGQSPKPGQPMLIAPIPGMPAGQQPQVAIMGSTPGSNPGGQQAGQGSAPMGNAPTQTNAPGQQAVVNAQRNSEGTSSVRTIEGQARQEQAGRTAQAVTLEAIAAEENALDDAALPSARREQVRRYFTELRKRFERE